MTMPSSFRDRDQAKFVECNGETAVRTKICQEAGETIAVEFAQAGTLINSYNEILSLGGLSTANVVLYTVPIGKTLTLTRVDFSGENKATFKIDINGAIQSKKRTYYTSFNGSFEFSGLLLSAGDIIKLIVENNSNSVSDFNGNLQGRLADA